MQLWQLGLLVGGGISLIVYLVHAAGGSRKSVLANEQAARDRFLEDYPDLTPMDVHLTRDGDAAFLALPDRSVGLVQAIGDCFLTRVLTGNDLSENSAQGVTLRLRIADITFKGGTYEFANENELQSVTKLLSNSGGHHA